MRQKNNPRFKAKTTCAVVVDGDNESWYINMLKRNERGISVDLRPQIPQQKSVDEQYKLVQALLNDYDKVFWIIDCDVVSIKSRIAKKGTETEEQKLNRYIEEVKSRHKKRVVVIKNNPCIEYWLLLHFEETTAHFHDCDAAGKRLKKHLAKYEKTQGFYTRQDNDIYLQLKPNLLSAINRAVKINERATGSPGASLSQMYELFYELGIAKRPK